MVVRLQINGLLVLIATVVKILVVLAILRGRR